MEALVRSTLFVSPESRINLGENGSMSLLYYRAESILVKMEALVCSTLFISLSPRLILL